MSELQLHLFSEKIQMNHNRHRIPLGHLDVFGPWLGWRQPAGFAQRSTKPFFLGEYGADASAACDHVAVGAGQQILGELVKVNSEHESLEDTMATAYVTVAFGVGVTKILVDASLLVAK